MLSLISISSAYATNSKSSEEQPIAFPELVLEAEAENWLKQLRSKTECADLIIKYAKEYNIPFLLMFAIAEQESNFNPYALNINSHGGFFPKSKSEAMSILNDKYARSYDVGLMQINSYWLRRFKLNPEEALEPEVNILLSAYILDECFHSYGMNWKALGCYHHPPTKDPNRSLSYAKRVWNRFLKFENWLAKENKKPKKAN